MYNFTCFCIGIRGFDREGKTIKGINLRESGYFLSKTATSNRKMVITA